MTWTRIRRKLRHPPKPLIHRRKVRRRHVKQLLKAVDHKIRLLIAVDLVARAHGALQLQRQALRLWALHGIRQFARRTQDARAIRTQSTGLPDQPELDGVPVQAAQHLARPQSLRLQAALAVTLHIVGKHRVEQQRHMAEEVVKDVGLDDVVKFLWRTDPVRHRELAVGQQREERHLGNQPRHGHDLPARGAVQALVDFLEAWNVVLDAQRGQGGDEGLAGQARQQGALALVQAPVGVVVGGGVGRMVLRAGVVGGCARVVAARRPLAGAVDDGFDGHGRIPLRPSCLRARRAGSGRARCFQTAP